MTSSPAKVDIDRVKKLLMKAKGEQGKEYATVVEMEEFIKLKLKEIDNLNKFNDYLYNLNKENSN